VAKAVKPQAPAKPAAAAKAPAPAKAPAVKPAPAPAAAAVKAPAAPAKKPAAPTVEVAPPPAAPLVAPVKKAPSHPLPPAGPTKSGALFYDSHMHTPLCKHAWGEPEEYAQQAVKAGLKGIIFTCHCPMPNGFWPTVRMSESEFDTYLAIVQRAADAYKGKLDIRLGIESEYYPGCEEYISALHQRADFHYVLGAVHWQAKEYLNKFETGTIENFRRTYFEHLAKSAESGLYDCLAHPDLVKNYHPDSWCFAIVKNTVSNALDRIAATGVAMELNTSGLNKSYSEMNPGLEMLRMMADRKIPIVLGSDSHRALRVGEHFVTALNHLTEAGYENVSYFLNRKRIDLPISEVLASLKKAADHNA
jgi:histidinol-phosphatase (PHP family)